MTKNSDRAFQEVIRATREIKSGGGHRESTDGAWRGVSRVTLSLAKRWMEKTVERKTRLFGKGVAFLYPVLSDALPWFWDSKVLLSAAATHGVAKEVTEGAGRPAEGQPQEEAEEGALFCWLPGSPCGDLRCFHPRAGFRNIGREFLKNLDLWVRLSNLFTNAGWGVDVRCRC